MDNGGPAFPHACTYPGAPTQTKGMTLRDYFAAAALPGIMANKLPTTVAATDDGSTVADYYAISAYMIADAMLATRSAGKE